MKNLFLKLLFLSALCLAACGTSSKGKEYHIGFDPSWYPLSLMGMESNVLAFSQELLLEISHLEHVNFVRINKNWDNLLLGLQQKKYDGMLSSMQPFLFTVNTYDFSDLYLLTGPVLVVPIDSNATSVSMMKGKEIGIIQGASSVLIAEQNPYLTIRTYESIPDALNDVLAGVIDGALIDGLPAMSYINNLYPDLKVVTSPLTDAGLRLITLHQESNELINLFNRALKKLKENGRYEDLAKKWNVYVKNS